MVTALIIIIIIIIAVFNLA